MTGRDLIIYILQNNLEDKPIFEDGKLLGFMNTNEAALKFNVGSSTIELWYIVGIIPGIEIRGEIFVPVNAVKKGDPK